MDDRLEGIARDLTEQQRRLICKNGRYFTTEEAMSLPLTDLMTRAGGYNRWQRTELGRKVVARLSRSGYRT